LYGCGLLAKALAATSLFCLTGPTVTVVDIE
jgi:hypothetical protein